MKMNRRDKRRLVRYAYKRIPATRAYTDAEVDAEIERLKNGLELDNLDDFSFNLACQIHVDQ
jgi:hypothetical protein